MSPKPRVPGRIWKRAVWSWCSGRTWSRHGAAEGWEPLAFRADQASSPGGGVVSQHKKLLEWERGLQWRGVTCQLAKSKTEPSRIPEPKV